MWQIVTLDNNSIGVLGGSALCLVFLAALAHKLVILEVEGINTWDLHLDTHCEAWCLLPQ